LDRPGTVAQACNLATLEVEIRRIMFQGQLEQKICETPFQPTAWHSSVMSVIPAIQEV
jgi:hypothetical protein